MRSLFTAFTIAGIYAHDENNQSADYYNINKDEIEGRKTSEAAPDLSDRITRIVASKAGDLQGLPRLGRHTRNNVANSNGSGGTLTGITNNGMEIIARAVGGIPPQFAGTSASLPIDRSALECICPDTYDLINDTCNRVVEFPQATLCAAGAELLSGECIRTTPAQEQCPYGYAQIVRQCIRRETAVPRLSCDDGFVLEATAGLSNNDPALVCQKQVAVDTILECPDGTSYQGECHTFRNDPPLYTCPATYEAVANNACHKVEQVRCGGAVEPAATGGILGYLATLADNISARGRKLEAEDVREPETSNPHISGKFGGSIPIDVTGSIAASTSGLLGGWSDMSNAAANGGRSTVNVRGGGSAADYKPYRPKGIATGLDSRGVSTTGPQMIDIYETCTADITIAATPYCDTGELVGRFCRQQVPVEPVEVCPAYGTPTACFAFERENPKTACPPNFRQECSILKQRTTNYLECECVKLDETALLAYCPVGYEFTAGDCVSVSAAFTGCPADAQTVGDVCQQRETIPAVCTYTVTANGGFGLGDGSTGAFGYGLYHNGAHTAHPAHKGFRGEFI